MSVPTTRPAQTVGALAATLVTVGALLSATAPVAEAAAPTPAQAPARALDTMAGPAFRAAADVPAARGLAARTVAAHEPSVTRRPHGNRRQVFRAEAGPARPASGKVRLRLAVSVPSETSAGARVQVPGSLRGRFVARGKRRAHQVVLQRSSGAAWTDVASARLRRGGDFLLDLGRVDDTALARVVVRRGGRTLLASRPTWVKARTAPVRGPATHHFVTRLATGTGDVLRQTPAYLDEPVELDVDQDGTADLRGVLSVDDGDATVEVDRLPGAEPDLPVQVEGVLHREGPAVLPQEYLSLGYDATADGAPASARLTLPLAGLAAPAPEVALGVRQDRATGGASRFTAEMFDGAVGARTAQSRVDLRPAEAPTELTSVVTLTGGGPEVVGFSGTSGSLTYAGPADGADLGLMIDSSERVAMGMDHLEVDLSGVAGQTAVDLTDDLQDGFLLDAQPAVGSVSARGTSGDAVVPTLPTLATGATALAADGAAFAFRSAAVDRVEADPAAGRLVVAAAPGVPLSVDVATSGARLSASTSALPAMLSVAPPATPAEPGLTWTTGGADLGDLQLGLSGARAATGLDEARLELTDAPPSGTIALPGGAGGPLSVTAPDHIGLLALSARTGSMSLPGLPPGERGYLQLPGPDGAAGAALTLAGVRSVSVHPTAAEFSAETLGGDDVTVDADTGAQSFLLAVQDVPEQLAVTTTAPTETAGAGIQWSAGTPVADLTYEAHGLDPSLGVDDLSLTLDDAPASGAVILPAELGDGVRLQSADPIGSIELRARTGSVTWPAFDDAADDGVLTSSSVEGDVLVARGRGLRLLDVDLPGGAVEVRTEGGRTIRIAAATDTASMDLQVGAAPATFTLGVQAQPDANGGGSAIQWQSATPADDVDLSITGVEATGLDELVLAAGDATRRGFPVRFSALLPAELADGVEVEARNAADQLTAVGLLDLQARRGTTPVPALGAATRSLVRVARDAGGEAARIRLLGTRMLALDAPERSLTALGDGDAPLDVDVDGPDHTLDLTVDDLPSSASFAIGRAPAGQGGGLRLSWTASTAVNQLAVAATGPGLDPRGADQDGNLQADVRGVPAGFTADLPQRSSVPQPPLARVSVSGANLTASGGPRIDELRLAAGAGSLPASGGNDKLTYLQGSSLNVGVKLTNLKGLSFHPINFTIDQEDASNGGTKPIDLNLSLPNETGPAATVTGQLNKPSFHTEVNLAVPPTGSGQPNRFTFVNGTAAQPRTMASLTWNAQNLGSIEDAALALKNLPRILQACLAADGACRPSDRIPPQLANYTGYSGSPAQNATAGGQNRPYPAMTSVDLNDFGTSGNSSAIGSMIEMDADLDLGDGNPILITDLYFHRITFDVGEHPTNKTFGAYTTQIPRIYFYVDSMNKPYVMNSVKYPPTVTEFKIGTNGSPATADRRLAWLPGGKCGGAIVFGACTGVTVLDTRASGSHSCGGQRSLSMQAGFLGTVNILNFPLVGELVPACS